MIERAACTFAALLAPAALWLIAGSCGADRDQPAAKPAASTPAALPAVLPAALPAPHGTYVAATTWHSKGKSPTAFEPPDPAQEIWRAFVNQEHPIQLKAPRWVPLPAADSVELAMPPGSRFHCLVTPLEVSVDSNDFSTKLKAWVLTRRLRCSADGWHSWTEYPEMVRVAPDGSREVSSQAQALLRELGAGTADDPTPHEIVVLVRPDKEQRAASTGPPRILPGVVVDED